MRNVLRCSLVLIVIGALALATTTLLESKPESARADALFDDLVIPKERASAILERTRADADEAQSLSLLDGAVTQDEYRSAVLATQDCVTRRQVDRATELGIAIRVEMSSPELSDDRFEFTYDYTLHVDPSDAAQAHDAAAREVLEGDSEIDAKCFADHLAGIEAVYQSALRASASYVHSVGDSLIGCLSESGAGPIAATTDSMAELVAAAIDGARDNHDVLVCVGSTPALTAVIE